jgi:hypothetical protein
MAAEDIAIIFGDSHLADRAWKDRPIEGDSYFSLDQITHAAVAMDVVAVIGAGDLIDKQLNRARPIGRFNDAMDRLEKSQIPFYFIQGQHEMMTDRPWASVHHWPTHLSNRRYKIGQFMVWGLDWTQPPLLQIALGTIPGDTDVGIFHQVWEEWMGVGNPEGKFTEIGSVKLGFSGDLHKTKRTVTVGRDGQPLEMYSPGSTSMQSIDEPTKKHYLVLRGDGTVVPKVLKTRPHLELGVLATSEEVDSLVERLPGMINATWDTTTTFPEEVRAPTIRVSYPHFLCDVERRFRAAIGDRGHLFAKELPPDKIETSGDDSVSIARVQARGQAMTLDSMLAGFLDNRDLSGLYTPSNRLLNAPDIAAELRAMRDEEVIDEGAEHVDQESSD